MPVKINIDRKKVLAKIDVAWNKSMKPLAEEILADCNQFCKEDTGMLIGSSLVHSQFDKGLLVWATPYARRQYYEIRNASLDVNPQATWRWAEVAKQHFSDRWARQAEILARRAL